MYSRKAGFVLMIGDFKGLILGPRQFLESSFKRDELSFLFHVKSSFSSWDIHIFILTFWLCKKTGRYES